MLYSKNNFNNKLLNLSLKFNVKFILILYYIYIIHIEYLVI